MDTNIAFKNNKTLLAILGRGIQRRSVESDAWEPTPDIEVCDEKGAHLPVGVSEDDNNSNSIIGGGELNVIAGALMAKQLNPAVVVCAYGARSKYLKEIGAPSESQVMSEKISAEMNRLGLQPPKIEIFDEAKFNGEESGTKQELQNILTLASQLNIQNIALVTVVVHIPRTALMAGQAIKENPAWGNIILQCYPSEIVALKEDPSQYEERIRQIFASKSYIRNLEREMKGINDFLAGKYKNVSSITK